MNADKYTYEIRRSEEDGEDVFSVTVREFPGVLALGETAAEAYEDALLVVGDLIERAVADGKALPNPYVPKTDTVSGRVTLRLGKALHAKVAQAAAISEISLNSLICQVLAEDMGARKAAIEIVEVASVQARSLTDAWTVSSLDILTPYDYVQTPESDVRIADDDTPNWSYMRVTQ